MDKRFDVRWNGLVESARMPALIAVAKMVERMAEERGDEDAALLYHEYLKARIS